MAPTSRITNIPKRGPRSAALVIFGAGGDLTKRLIVPALCHLAQFDKLPSEFAIIGVDRHDQTADQWRDDLAATLFASPSAGIDRQVWARLSARMRYLRGDLTNAETFTRLAKLLAEQWDELKG